MKINQIVLCMACGTLTACVNLGAVTDYSASAGQVLGDTKPAMRWRDSEKTLVALSVPGDTCPIGRTGRLPQKDFDAAYEDLAKVHGVLGNYFKVLGELASDKVPLPSAALDTSLAAAKKAGVKIDKEDEAALAAVTKLLSRALDAYRHKKVREVMEASEADIARLIDVLEGLASLYEGEIGGERVQAAKFMDCALGPLGDLSDKYWGRREKLRIDTAYKADLAAMKKYKDALGKIKADHQKIRDALALDADNLGRTIKAIADTRKELDQAHEAIQKLQGA